VPGPGTSEADAGVRTRIAVEDRLPLSCSKRGPFGNMVQ
jgi:hypothetical protein